MKYEKRKELKKKKRKDCGSEITLRRRGMDFVLIGMNVIFILLCNCMVNDIIYVYHFNYFLSFFFSHKRIRDRSRKCE